MVVTSPWTALGVCACLLVAAAAGGQQPNIVFMLADDLGYGDVGVYPNPSKVRLQTPHIDKLASEGMRFVDAYAGYSVCAPSRTTLMTGLHVGHFAPNNGGSGLLNSTTTPTVATLLSKAGYDTALIGKWGLDGNYPKPRPPSTGFPTVQGFDYFYGQSDQFQCHDYYPSFMFNNTDNETIAQNIGASPTACGPDLAKCVWSGDLWTDAAVGFVSNSRGQRSAAKPFFLYFAPTAPHAGAVGNVGENDVPAPRVATGPYANQTGWPKVERDFATAVYDVDAAVGRLVAAIDALPTPTVILFSSDNGAHQEGGHQYQFFNSSGYLNGFKRSIHDGGHRAALIVRWPGQTPPNSVSWQQFCFYDFLATATDLAGIPASARPPHLDSQSILPTIQGKAQEQPPFIYHQYSGCDDPVCHQNKALNCAFGQNIRYGNWSGVCVGPNRPCTGEAPGAFFLYDMAVDQAQAQDVAAANPAVVKTILQLMDQQYNPSWPNPRPPPPPPPPPSPPAMAAPCGVGAWTGLWYGAGGHNYSMHVDAASGGVTLAVTDSCCHWKTANGSVSADRKTIMVTAVGPDFKLENRGTVSGEGCHVQWSERWAPWFKIA